MRKGQVGGGGIMDGISGLLKFFLITQGIYAREVKKLFTGLRCDGV